MRYDQLRDDWLRRKSVDRSTLTIDELAIRFLEYAIGYYTKDGNATSEVACIRAALHHSCSSMDQRWLRPWSASLKGVRDGMIRRGWKRKAINRQVQRIQRAFRWGVENELVPEVVLSRTDRQCLDSQGGGRQPSRASQSSQCRCPLVDAIRCHVSRHVWAMIQLQLLTGARPGEIVSMRVGRPEHQRSNLGIRATLTQKPAPRKRPFHPDRS